MPYFLYIGIICKWFQFFFEFPAYSTLLQGVWDHYWIFTPVVTDGFTLKLSDDNIPSYYFSIHFSILAVFNSADI